MKSRWAIAAELIDPQDRWAPQERQREASELAGRVDELLYGGAAGGGKSEWLCEYLIAQCELHPGNRVVAFRRVFPSLNRTLIPRLKQKLYGRARYNMQEHTFTFPNTSVLEVGSLQYADDVYGYQGAEYGCIAFEEVTEFMESQVDYLIGRLRSTIPGVRPHLIATTNPGGTGHAWVKRRWVKPKADDIEEGELPPAPHEVWRPAATEELPRPPLRVFVPAKLEDNPALLQADPGYVDRLNRNRNRAIRLALREGDWDAIDAIEGALWTRTDLDNGRVRPENVEHKTGVLRRVLAVDPSEGEDSGDAFGVSHCARGMDNVGYVMGSWEWRASPRTMAARAVRLYHELGCDALVVEKNHGGKWMLEVFRQVDPNINLKVVWASDNKRTRAEPVAALFEEDVADLRKFRARIAGYHEELEEQLTTTVFEPGEISPDRLDAMVWAMTDLMLGDMVAKSRPVRDTRLRGRR
ncbi:MAG TPA: phage terminase large subunit [Actinomycetota bacterium]|nr:phage terminase large subunit [Actinomycetota bacterium]